MGENWTFVKTPQQVLGDRKKNRFPAVMQRCDFINVVSKALLWKESFHKILDLWNLLFIVKLGKTSCSRAKSKPEKLRL